MTIKNKLLALVAVSLLSLLFIAGSAFYIAGNLREATDFTNKRSIPIMKDIYEVEVDQQALAGLPHSNIIMGSFQAYSCVDHRPRRRLCGAGADWLFSCRVGRDG